MHSFWYGEAEKQFKALESGPEERHAYRGVDMCQLCQRKCQRAYCGAPALLTSNLRPWRITLAQSQNCDSPWKQNGLVDRLRHLTAQTFASDMV
jgi:hypothetical protein